jgi:hypothetical protein
MGEHASLVHKLTPHTCCIAVFTAAAPQGKYQLVYQRNGNLVLYQVQGTTIIWNAGVQSNNPGRAELQVCAGA